LLLEKQGMYHQAQELM